MAAALPQESRSPSEPCWHPPGPRIARIVAEPGKTYAGPQERGACRCSGAPSEVGAEAVGLDRGEAVFMRVGIEVGGTFTDLVAIGAEGIRITKVPSVPAAPDEGAFNALMAGGIAIAAIDDLAHGS